MKSSKANEIIEELKAEGYTVQDIIDFSEDGEAMDNFGLHDQEVAEEIHSILS